MPKQKVRLTFDVPYYGEVEVDAKSPEDARYEVVKALGKGRELSHPMFKNVSMEPDYTEAGMVTVLSDEPPTPPFRRRSKKIKTPTFRNDG